MTDLLICSIHFFYFPCYPSDNDNFIKRFILVFPSIIPVKFLKLIGEKPYKCDQCLTTFSRIYDLNIHKMIHNGFIHDLFYLTY